MAITVSLMSPVGEESTVFTVTFQSVNTLDQSVTHTNYQMGRRGRFNSATQAHLQGLCFRINMLLLESTGARFHADHGINGDDELAGH